MIRKILNDQTLDVGYPQMLSHGQRNIFHHFLLDLASFSLIPSINRIFVGKRKISWSVRDYTAASNDLTKMQAGLTVHKKTAEYVFTLVMFFHVCD